MMICEATGTLDPGAVMALPVEAFGLWREHIVNKVSGRYIPGPKGAGKGDAGDGNHAAALAAIDKARGQ